MADRGSLHPNHLPEFKTWLEEHGWRVIPSPPGNGYEMLRARHPQKQHPVIFYRRDLPSQHLTSFAAGMRLVGRFLRDRRTKKHASNAERKSMLLTVQDGSGNALEDAHVGSDTERRIQRALANYTGEWGPCACGEIGMLVGQIQTETGLHTTKACTEKHAFSGMVDAIDNATGEPVELVEPTRGEHA